VDFSRDRDAAQQEAAIFLGILDTIYCSLSRDELWGKLESKGEGNVVKIHLGESGWYWCILKYDHAQVIPSLMLSQVQFSATVSVKITAVKLPS